MRSLSKRELETIHESIVRAEHAIKDGIKELSDIFLEGPRLIVSPNNVCNCSCLHCIADSTPEGITMPYYDFAAISPEFIEIFSAADFGRRGNPLLYNSDGHDIVDLMEFLNRHGINKFTLALALQKRHLPVIKKLEDFASGKQASIETMVTYHHYFNGLNPDVLARGFNATLKNYIGFSKRIIISLLGDKYSQQAPSKAEEVEAAFYSNLDTILADMDTSRESRGQYHVNYRGKQSEIAIPALDTRVYPLGRFRKYLAKQGILQSYEERFEEGMGDYVCPDLIKWPGIIIEPDGGLNLCGSFEAISCCGAVITNIFEKPFSVVQEELMQFHRKEMQWFIDNLPDIIAGKVPVCKLKNHCYRN